MVGNFGVEYVYSENFLLKAFALLFPRQTTERSRHCLFVDCFTVGTLAAFPVYTAVSWRVSTVNQIFIFHVKMLHELPDSVGGTH